MRCINSTTSPTNVRNKKAMQTIQNMMMTLYQMKHYKVQSSVITIITIITTTTTIIIIVTTTTTTTVSVIVTSLLQLRYHLRRHLLERLRLVPSVRLQAVLLHAAAPGMVLNLCTWHKTSHVTRHTSHLTTLSSHLKEFVSNNYT